VVRNFASENRQDGMRVLTGNAANFNGNLGIEAVPGVVDGVATGLHTTATQPSVSTLRASSTPLPRHQLITVRVL
jgi:hypothetical protein